VLVVVLVGCGGKATVPEPAMAGAPSPVVVEAPGPVGPPRLRFEGIPVPGDAATRRLPAVATRAHLGETALDVGFTVLRKSLVDGFGEVRTRGGAAVALACGEQDFDSLLLAGGKPWLVSHFECTPGAVYVSALQQDAAGVLSAVGRATPVDWDASGGVWFPCSGQVSPWGTHLGSEEYEPDAGALRADNTLAQDEYGAWKAMSTWAPGQVLNVWDYGWPTEISLDAEGKATAGKHYALGRFSHELSYVLPDERTVYQSDDGTATGFYLFVADRPRDLSAGTLYAASYEGAGDSPGVRWVSLGHATAAEVKRLVDARVPFSSLFAREAPSASGTCREGFRFVSHSYGKECLQLAAPSAKVPDPALAASRLETRRYAAYVGASTELEKFEGLAFDAESRTLYLAISQVKGRMLAEDGGPGDQVRMDKNTCGVVFAGATARSGVDTAGAPIASEYVVSALRPAVAGRPLDAPDAANNGCDPEAIANPDNVTFLAGHGLLTIAEDTKTKRGHTNASLWTWDVQGGSLVRILSAPVGGEVTGIHWIPDLLGHGYLTAVVQHPWDELPEGQVIPADITEEDKRSLTAVFGPFPPLARP
jgi:secreted PhoX family phosphatase